MVRILAAFLYLAIVGCSVQDRETRDVSNAAGSDFELATPDLKSDFVQLKRIPTVRLVEEEGVQDHQHAEIQKLIERLDDRTVLRTLSLPDVTGRIFLPLDFEANGSFESSGSEFDTSSKDAIRKLVSVGPAAIPLLLRELANDKPTGVVIKREVYFSDEVPSNPLNSMEQSVLQVRANDKEDFWETEPAAQYQLKVGDLCFAILGQIVGRDYQPVRYQPTNFVVVHSPVSSPSLCAALRAIWSAPSPQKKLFDSLITDYSTEGIFNGDNLDGWGIGSDLQIEAAMRLVFYFPKSSSEIISSRLANLNVSRCGPSASTYHSPAELRARIEREVANGVSTSQFIGAVAWSDHPSIQMAVEDLEERTDEPDIQLVIERARAFRFEKN